MTFYILYWGTLIVTNHFHKINALFFHGVSATQAVSNTGFLMFLSQWFCGVLFANLSQSTKISLIGLFKMFLRWILHIFMAQIQSE